MSKKGLSPVIATVLLISIGLILATIIFIWARSFLIEQVQKFGEPVERACKDVNFEAEALKSGENIEISIVNRGKVPLYGIEVREKNDAKGEIKSVGKFSKEMIRNGETGSIPIIVIDNELESGEILNIVPIIIGEKVSERTQHVCDLEFGQEVQIQSI